MFDLTILTASKFLNPIKPDWYQQQVLDEDKFVQDALEKNGLYVTRTNWNNPDFDWTKTRAILFRTIWDYFDRFNEFVTWLEDVKSKSYLINPYSTIKWNMDKHYLNDLRQKGINIPPTLFIEKGDKRSINEIVAQSEWSETILKPTVSGAGRHTYKLEPDTIDRIDSIYKQLINEEAMMLQEFQENITSKGEVAMIFFGGEYSHAILKKAKKGEFRVQDDFGGTVHNYEPSKQEIDFGKKILSLCEPIPVYARVDYMWDNNNHLSLSELELIEPELWFRKYLPAANLFANKLIDFLDEKYSSKR